MDPRYKGIVLSTTSRFYTTIRSFDETTPGFGLISVKSPQFIDAVWEYKVNFKENDLVEVVDCRYLLLLA